MIIGKQAPKLKVGDEIRILSPSRSLSIVSEENRLIAQQRLEELGFKVSFRNMCWKMMILHLPR